MTTTDRRATGYEPDFDIDMAVGGQAELFVCHIIESLKTGTIEVKYDARYKDTGNVFVEYSCLRRGTWRPSGISVTTAYLWAFVLDLGAVCVVINTDVLKSAAKQMWRRRVEMDRGSHPTKGVLISLNWLLRQGTEMRNV